MKPMGMIPCFLAARSSLARAVTPGVVLEGHLVETREGVPDVRRVVDRQAALHGLNRCRQRRCVGKLRTLLRGERWHRRMIGRSPEFLRGPRGPNASG